MAAQYGIGRGGRDGVGDTNRASRILEAEEKKGIAYSHRNNDRDGDRDAGGEDLELR